MGWCSTPQFMSWNGLTLPKFTLVLGASGYIGSHLQRKVEGQNFVFLARTSTLDLIENVQRISTIINLCASPAGAEEEVSFQGNFDYPMSVFNHFKDSRIKWVQVNSYYQLQPKIQHFRNYSLHKAQFAQLLMHQNHYSITNLYLPHIFGGKERGDRLIPTLSRIKLQKVQNLGNRKQYVPLLHIDDALTAILLSVESRQQEATATPFWHDQLNLLLENLFPKQVVDKFAYFDNSNVPIFQNLIEFPPALKNFAPKFQLKELKQYIETSH